MYNLLWLLSFAVLTVIVVSTPEEPPINAIDINAIENVPLFSWLMKMYKVKHTYNSVAILQ